MFGRLPGRCFRATSIAMLAWSAAMVAWCVVQDMEFGAALWSAPLALYALSYPPLAGRRQPHRSRFWTAFTAGPAGFFLFVAVAHPVLVNFDMIILASAVPLGLVTYRALCGLMHETTDDVRYLRWMV